MLYKKYEQKSQVLKKKYNIYIIKNDDNNKTKELTMKR